MSRRGVCEPCWPRHASGTGRSHVTLWSHKHSPDTGRCWLPGCAGEHRPTAPRSRQGPGSCAPARQARWRTVWRSVEPLLMAEGRFADVSTKGYRRQVYVAGEAIVAISMGLPNADDDLSRTTSSAGAWSPSPTSSADRATHSSRTDIRLPSIFDAVETTTAMSGSSSG